MPGGGLPAKKRAEVLAQPKGLVREENEDIGGREDDRKRDANLTSECG